MHDEALLEQIRDYIRRHRATYTLEALRDRLIRDGAPPDAVGRVLVEMGTQPQAPTASPYLGPAPIAPQAAPSRWNVKTIFAVVAGLVVVNAGVVALAFWSVIATSDVVVCGLLLGLAIIAEVAAAVIVGRRNLSVSLGLVIGIIVTPVVVGVLLLGTCLYILSQY